MRPPTRRGVAGFREIRILSDVVGSDGRYIPGLATPAQTWHSDGSNIEAPNSYIFTYIFRTPGASLKSGWLDMHKVYENLPERIKQKIAPLRVINHLYSRGADVDLAWHGKTLPLAERMKGAAQPLVRRHAITGKPSLFMYYRRDAIIPGMPETESRALLDELWAIVEAAPYRWHEKDERVGDLIMWDNRCTLHRRLGWVFGTRTFWVLGTQGEKVMPMFEAVMSQAQELGLGY